MEQIELMSLEALKAQEAILLRELEIENSEKNNLLQKHRQVLLNSAHLLRLYHQSSKEASEIIINNTNKKPEISELKPELNEDEIISKILSKNGLRLLWDALDNLELLRAYLMLEYLKTKSVQTNESLSYFESQLTKKIIQVLTSEQTDSNIISHTIKALNSTNSKQLVEYLKLELSKDLVNGSVKIINFYNNLKLQTTTPPPKSINLFLEQESNFCEYPQLKNIQKDTESFNVLELKNIIIGFTSNFFTENQPPSIDPELLKGLELEDELVKTILNKVNELKLKGNTEKLRVDISDLFDKLMKFIQTTIRSNSSSFAAAVVSDDILKSKFSFICETIENSNIQSEELEIILKSFDQIISNKSNIIFTIHKNELSTLNSKLEIPIPSKLYLASCICDNLIKEDVNNNIKTDVNNNLKKEINDSPSGPLRKYVEQIKNKFYEVWLTDIKTTFTKLKEENNEIFALIWLSDSFLSLKISNDKKSDILKNLDIDKGKFIYQAALLIGLSFEPETISTPKLQNLTISEPARDLLSHFISI